MVGTAKSPTFSNTGPGSSLVTSYNGILSASQLPTPLLEAKLPRLLWLLFLLIFGGLALTYATFIALDSTSIGVRLAISFEWLTPETNFAVDILDSNPDQTRVGHYLPKVNSIINQHGSSTLSASERVHLGKIITVASLANGLDPLLVAAVIRQESSFRRTAVSPKGARGLMQIIPSTGEFVASRHNLSWRGTHALFDPAYNVKLGIKYLRNLREQFRGNWFLALAAYNWGPGNVERAKRAGRRIPREVTVYASAILFNYAKWRSSRGVP